MDKLMTLEEMKNFEWVVSWSGGKDSTATIILMHRYGIPIKKIIYVRMMFDENLPATLPVMTNFVDSAKKAFEDWGYTVEIVKSKQTAMDIARMIYRKSKYEGRNGHPYGITNFVRGMCNFTNVKQKTIRALENPDDYEMIGYASDETERLSRLGGKKQSVMVALNIPERATFDICRQYNLLSPLYDLGLSRDGCWFCPNASVRERRMIKTEYPELFAKIKSLVNMCDYDIYGLYKSGRNGWLKDRDIYIPDIKNEPYQLTFTDCFPWMNKNDEWELEEERKIKYGK